MYSSIHAVGQKARYALDVVQAEGTGHEINTKPPSTRQFCISSTLAKITTMALMILTDVRTSYPLATL